MSAEYDLSSAFERIENYLIDSMMRNFKHHRAEETAEGYNWEQWQAKQLEALEEYRRNNQEKFSTEFAELNDRVSEMLRSTADDAGYRQEQKILKAIQKGFTPSRPSSTMQASFFKLNERKMNALVRSTTDDLSRVEFAVLRRSNDAYRKAIFGAQTFMNSGAATYEQAVDMATKDMLSAGLQCVEYSNGARHTLHDYAEMAIRTANKRAYLRGEGAKMQEWGISTVIINRRHGACGRCADFVGMVFIDDVYAGGKPSDHGGKYPLLSDAMKAGLFHPRCKDSSSLYIEGISTPPDREVLPKKAQEDLTEIERAEQRAAYGRRMEKMNRRLSKYALDPDNKKMYRGRAEQWSEYTEKWQSYHEKQLAKAEKSGIINKTVDTVDGSAKALYDKLSRDERKEIISRGQAVDKPVFSYDTAENRAMSYLQNTPKIEGVYDVCSHGTPYSIEFFRQDYPDGDKRAYIDAYTLSAIIKGRKDYKEFISLCRTKGLDPCVRLLACETGRKSEGVKCFAELLAEQLGVSVQAPNKMLYVYPDGKYYVGKRKSGAMELFKVRR